jgi:hypothetical protein
MNEPTQYSILVVTSVALLGLCPQTIILATLIYLNRKGAARCVYE